MREGFASGAPELDEWLSRYSWQNQRANNATTFVSCNESRVLGYYALTVASVARGEAPEPLAKGAPAQIGCLLLARLAVDEEAQGRGLGRGLLSDCLRRASSIAGEAGMKALLVHCRDETARDFYMSQCDFLPSPAADLQLLLPMKWVTAHFGDT